MLETLKFQSAREIVGKTDYDLFPVQAAQLRGHDEQVRMLGKPLSFEEIIDHPHVGIRYFSVIKTPLLDDRGVICGIIGNSIDITGIKKAQSAMEGSKKEIEEKYKHTDRLFKAVVSSLPGSIYWKDSEGVYLGCNDFMIGHSKFNSSEKIIGKTDYELWGDQADALVKNDQEVMNSKQPVCLEESVHLPNGEKKSFAVVKMPLLDDNGEVVGIIGNSLDITELKQTQQELKEAKEKAERLSKAKTSFLVNMSHDIKTPIAGIMGLADMLRGQLQGESLEYVEDIYASATQSMAFFNHCLDLMKSDEVESLLVKEPFRLRDVTEQIESLFRAAVKDKQLTFYLNVDPKIPDYLLGSREAVYRILLNLVGNAIKFTKVGQVSVLAKLGEQSTEKTKVIKLSVKDTGIGIPKDKQRDIFDQFTRLNPSCQGVYEGKGLGLFEIKQLVNGLGGEIRVHSDEGKGSEFMVIIRLDVPLLNPEEYEPTDHEEAQLWGSAKKSQPAPQSQIIHEDQLNFEKMHQKILLVEDDKIAQTVVLKLLSNLACEVDLAVNGGSALDQFVPGKYDLVLMDLGLPDMMGDEVAKQMRIREQGSGFHVPIIAVTAHPLPPTIEECRVAGMEGVLSKPLSPKQAAQLMQRYIRLKPVVVEGLDAFDTLTTTHEYESGVYTSGE